MRVLDHTELDSRAIEGIKGTLTALDVTSDEAFGVGLRIVPANAKVPKPGIPYARGRRVLFVLRGQGTISNGEYYEKIMAGRFVTLDEGEKPSFQTQDEELVLLEVRHHAQGSIVPPTVTTMPIAVDSASTQPKATTYDVVD